MAEFPRTTVGGVSMPRLIVGTNWFLGYSHTSLAKDHFIRDIMTVDRIADILCVFLENGVDAVMGMPTPELAGAIEQAVDRVGRDMKRIYTPFFNILPGGPAESEPEAVFDAVADYGASFCFPHQGVTDRLLDTLHRELRDYDRYAAMIRERGMLPGLSTHTPESVVIADETDADVEAYIQIYNAAGFMMPLEADWAMRIIRQAKKPVMTIKPLGAGRLLPAVGLAFSWNTIRECDMVTIGTSSPDEAREVIDLSTAFLERRLPDNELQTTRSKAAVESANRKES